MHNQKLIYDIIRAYNDECVTSLDIYMILYQTHEEQNIRVALKKLVKGRFIQRRLLYPNIWSYFIP